MAARSLSPEAGGDPGLDLPPSRALQDALARANAQRLVRGGMLYPDRLASLDDAPAALFVRGLAATLSARGVAIVGSRAPTTHARDVARTLARALVRAGLVVISGLARGIDAAAHRGALDASGLTVAVLGHGIDLVYPSDHRQLADQIAAHGAIVTEFEPGVPPLPHHFPRRNRLVTGLAEALVVVEARERSGTLSSAGHALAQGKDVFVVPGQIGVAACAGSNRLLREGAHVLLDPADVLLRLGLAPAGPERPAANDLSTERAAPGDPLSGALATRVLRALDAGPLARDALARRLGCDGTALSLALLELELDGCVGEERDGRIARRGPR